MTGKITAAGVAAILLGSAGVASAQIGRTGPTYSHGLRTALYGPVIGDWRTDWGSGALDGQGHDERPKKPNKTGH